MGIIPDETVAALLAMHNPLEIARGGTMGFVSSGNGTPSHNVLQSIKMEAEASHVLSPLW